MKFYEFGDEFEYYALIGAETEEKAIEYYREVVADFEEENDSNPTEITQEEAKNKLINSCNDSDEERENIKFFEDDLERNEPFLVLVDGNLF